MSRTALRICPICEATCGLVLTIDDAGRVDSARGDRDDVFSHGFICPKGASFPELDNDPDRLDGPLIRRDGELVEVGWDEAFAAAWEEADEAATQTLEAEAWKRARSGSDRLLLFLLQARRPQTYRTNARVELAGDGGGPIQTMVVPEGLNDHERAALRQAIDAELARRGAEVEG